MLLFQLPNLCKTYMYGLGNVTQSHIWYNTLLLLSPGICQRLVLWILGKYFALYICVSNSVNPPPPIVQPPLCLECPRAMQSFSTPALLSFQNRPRQALLSICEYSRRRCVPCETCHLKTFYLKICHLKTLLQKGEGGSSMSRFAHSGVWPLQEHPPLTICSAVIDFGPDGRLISGPTYLALCYIIATHLYGWRVWTL